MTTLHLTYDPNAQGAISGWFLPATDVAAWIAAAAQAPISSTKFYLAPRSVADHTAVGLVALHTPKTQVDQHIAQPKSQLVAQPIPTGAVPTGAIPLVNWSKKQSRVELWLPLYATLAPQLPAAELESIEQFDAANRYLWLPPDQAGQARLIQLTPDDEIDLSVLIKPPTIADSAQTIWLAPPRINRLAERALDLQVSPEFLPANPFSEEQESIGGESDDLMSLDDEGQARGGGLGSMAGRMFRKSLENLLEALKGKPNQAQASNREQAGSSGQSSSASKSAGGSSSQKMAQALYQKLQNMLADQREKQLKKLLALMDRDPDRALKYAVPMANQGAPRGLAQPGSELSQNNVDFSLPGLFGGGQPVDPWQINYQLQAQLIAAYRNQADRELAAGRYRRAAYVYAHLIGDISAAAMVLEKGKFFLEAGALYKKLDRPLDQARCLRSSGQLAEAAEIYENLKHYESAAEMWNGVGNQAAAMSAYEKACAAAIQRHDILKAVNILDRHLSDPARAEQLLWSQWPRGHQVFECTKLAFKRLADRNCSADAQRRFDEVVAATERTEHTLLARLCADLSHSFPDRTLRSRAEDQCRLSVVDRLTLLTNTEFQQRMQILGNLHPDDRLLQRDIRRFEREQKSCELQLQPDTSDSSHRGRMRALSSVRLADGQYGAAMMIGQQLFTMSKSKTSLQLSRYAQLDDVRPLAIHGRIHLDLWDIQQPLCCHFNRESDPVTIYAGYGKTQPESQLLTSPLGGDEFWIVHSVSAKEGFLAGIQSNGSQCWWDPLHYQVTIKRNGLPHVISLAEWVQAQIPELLTDAVYTSQPAHLALVLGSHCYVSWHKRIACVTHGQQPREVAAFNSRIQWMAPSLPLTLPRLLVATENELWVVTTPGGARPEKIHQDELFTAAAFLPGGRIAATTDRELLLFQRGRQAMKLMDRQELPTSQVVSILSLTPGTVGVLFEHGVMHRWRVS